MRQGMTIGSLFAGIGGLELGLERAGVGHTVWQVEKDEYCRAVLAKHWPNAQRYEDVLNVGRANLVPVDVICGGFPCQDISYAGDGAGLAGDRSGLWYEFARIVRELGPKYAVVENVAALTTRGLGDVLGTLADIGYDAEWSCVRAADVGAPHLRDRIFLVAYSPRVGCRRRSAEAGWQAWSATEGLRRTQPDAHMADADGERELQPQGRVADERRWVGNGGWWSIEPDVGRVAHGVPSRVDRLRALGNAVVPAVAEVVGRVILELERQRVAA